MMTTTPFASLSVCFRILLVWVSFFASAYAARPPLPVRPEGEPLRVACVGDSITYGAGAEAARSYPDQLQELLGAAWDVGNFGVSGRTLLKEGDMPYWNEPAYQQAKAFAPDAVIIMLGTNDTKPQNWSKKASFPSDYSDLIASFRDLPSKPRIFLCRPIPVPPPGNWGINEAGVREIITMVNKLAAEHDLDVIDMYATLRDRPHMIPDRVHPDSAGALEMAKAAYLALTGVSSRPITSLTRVHSLFRHHAVLPRNVSLPVWGTAPSGQGVTVEFAGQKKSTIAADGRWCVFLDSMPANSKPQRMVIRGSDTQIVNDILVGDVWLASGQSNMERQLGPRPPQKPLDGWEAAASAANLPLIREYYVPHRVTLKPLLDARSRWTVCSPASAAEFSAVGFYFARALQPAIGVPVGIIHASWGGTPAESWMRPEALAGFPDLAESLKQLEQRATGTAGDASTPKVNQYSPSVLRHGMLAPFSSFPLKGVIWYQGESNNKRAQQYRTLFPALIQDFRDTWGARLPFLFVQIAPHKDMLPELREAQLETFRNVSGTSMAVTVDVGDANDIHPTNKAPVGARLALGARALAYGEDIEFMGPVFKSASFKTGKVVVRFSHVGSGLVAKGGVVKGFQLAGADGRLVPAKAVIKGEKLEVSSPEVAEPVELRFGWENVPDTDLWNTAGLPASPFRARK